MTAIIKTELSGETSAFTPDGKLVMNFGRPYIAWGFYVKDVEAWLTTLEETMMTMPGHHRYCLEKLYFSLKTAHRYHEQEHQAVITDAPSEDDLMSYLCSYATAMNLETMEKRK